MPKHAKSRGGSSGLYTSSGQRVHNAAAYAGAGGRAFTSAGRAVRDPVAYSGAVEARVRQNTSSPKYLYHYTDAASASAIGRSGTIRQSVGPGDCSLGEGVYMTSKPPSKSSAHLLANNYGSSSSSSSSKSRVEAYVRVDADRVAHSGGRGKAKLGRDVFVVGGDVKLSSAGARVGRR